MTEHFRSTGVVSGQLLPTALSEMTITVASGNESFVPTFVVNCSVDYSIKFSSILHFKSI